jgi:hypothetical protein
MKSAAARIFPANPLTATAGKFPASIYHLFNPADDSAELCFARHGALFHL